MLLRTGEKKVSRGALSLPMRVGDGFPPCFDGEFDFCVYMRRLGCAEMLLLLFISLQEAFWLGKLCESVKPNSELRHE